MEKNPLVDVSEDLMKMANKMSTRGHKFVVLLIPALIKVLSASLKDYKPYLKWCINVHL